MSRSRSRLAADWFAKLRFNTGTNEVEVDGTVTTTDLSTAVDTKASETLTTVGTTYALNNLSNVSNVTSLTSTTITGTTANLATVDLGDWTVTESAGILYFATGGTNKMKLDASGNLTVSGDVTAFGTV